MARNVIILDQVSESGDYTVAFWLDVPAARQRFYANPTTRSVFIDASADEILALQLGVRTEIVERFNVPFGTSFGTLRTALLARRAELQTRVTNNNPWVRYGSFHDGVTWTAVTVA